MVLKEKDFTNKDISELLFPFKFVSVKPHNRKVSNV